MFYRKLSRQTMALFIRPPAWCLVQLWFYISEKKKKKPQQVLHLHCISLALSTSLNCYKSIKIGTKRFIHKQVPVKLSHQVNTRTWEWCSKSNNSLHPDSGAVICPAGHIWWNPGQDWTNFLYCFHKDCSVSPRQAKCQHT